MLPTPTAPDTIHSQQLAVDVPKKCVPKKPLNQRTDTVKISPIAVIAPPMMLTETQSQADDVEMPEAIIPTEIEAATISATPQATSIGKLSEGEMKVPQIETQMETASILKQTVDSDSPSSILKESKDGAITASIVENTIGNVNQLPPAVQEILAKSRLHKGFFEEKFPEDMPPGWVLHIHKRKYSNNKKEHIDRYWYTPKTGKRLRSKPEVKRFLDHYQTSNGDEDIAWQLFKGGDKKTLKIASKLQKRKRGTPASEVDSSTRADRSRRRRISGSKLVSSESDQVSSKEKDFVAESKLPQRPRKKVATKKGYSSTPFEFKSQHSFDLPEVAESK